MPPSFEPPVIPITFPRQQWWDTEWWNLDTKIGRARNAAHGASLSWFRAIRAQRRDWSTMTPWTFKLAVYDRVDQINHELRRQRQYTGVHATVEAWQKETDGLIRMAFDEGVIALPPDSPKQHPSFEETRDFARLLLDHQYVQGKDAEPTFTATGDWDEDEYVDQFGAWKEDHDSTTYFWRVWPFDSEAAAKEEETICTMYYQSVTFLHPLRSVAPEEWNPWKYKIWASSDQTLFVGPSWQETNSEGTRD